jgi:predicted O-methyltransferase YrrM
MNLEKKIYSDELKKSRLAQLLETPRMYYTPLVSDEHGYANTTGGLLHLVQELITAEDLVVEVGSFSGVSSRVFALGCRELHCIDPYSWPAVFEAEKMFEAMMPDYPNIKKIKMTSAEGSKLYKDHSIDFVYIDADHTYRAVVDDINNWISKVKKGGYLGGHDIYISDVRRAVEERFGTNYKTYSDTSWVVKL